MIKHSKTRLGLSLLVAGGLCGCAGGQPFWSASKDSAADAQQARMAEAQQSLEAYKSQQQASSTAPGYASQATAGISSAYQGAKQAVTGAFTPEPRVVQVSDTSSQDKGIGADIFLTAGAFFEGQGQLERAKDQYERVLQNDPTQLMALVSLARLTDRMGNAAGAEAYYQKALAAHPRSGLAHNDLGLFFARAGSPQKAVAELQQAVTAEPENIRYRNNFATVLVELGQVDRALVELQRTGSPPEAHYNLGFLLNSNGNYDLAQQHLREALRLNPQLQPARALLEKIASQQPRSGQPGYAPRQANSAPATYSAGQPAVRQLPPVQR